MALFTCFRAKQRAKALLMWTAAGLPNETRRYPAKSREYPCVIGKSVRHLPVDFLEHRYDAVVAPRHGVQGVECSNHFAPTIINNLARPNRRRV